MTSSRVPAIRPARSMLGVICNLFPALARYNGSFSSPEYPDMMRAAWEKHWAWKPRQLAVR